MSETRSEHTLFYGSTPDKPLAFTVPPVEATPDQPLPDQSMSAQTDLKSSR